MRKELTESQMGLMRGSLTMAAPRKYSKTTELWLVRRCQQGRGIWEKCRSGQRDSW